jgi:hypothetical protein
MCLLLGGDREGNLGCGGCCTFLFIYFYFLFIGTEGKRVEMVVVVGRG